MDRRAFLGAAGLGAAGTGWLSSGTSLEAVLTRMATAKGSPATIAEDEEYWDTVARAFTVDRSLINLNNGGVSPAPAHVQEMVKRHLDYANNAPPYHMWRIQQPGKEGIRARLAHHLGVHREEIAITRNASESLMICQFGIDLEHGDQVLTTNQDYPRMLDTFRQRTRREGIELVQVSIPTPCEDDKEIVRRFEKAITDRTKLILASHVVNLSGQILPVAEICRLGRRRGIPVIVDGAHAIGHLDFKISDLDCDFYASSLHKWLFAPIGTGLLYVRRTRIGDVWPLQAANASLDDDIRKFEQIGTHPMAQILAIGEALTFLEVMKPKRKLARLNYLREYWMKRLADHEKIRFHTSRDPRYAGAIATVEILGLEPGDVARHLMTKHRILTSPIHHDEFRGVRISPSVYTTPQELDLFVKAMQDLATNGIPS